MLLETLCTMPLSRDSKVHTTDSNPKGKKTYYSCDLLLIIGIQPKAQSTSYVSCKLLWLKIPSSTCHNNNYHFYSFTSVFVACYCARGSCLQYLLTHYGMYRGVAEIYFSDASAHINLKVRWTRKYIIKSKLIICIVVTRLQINF